MAKGLFSVHSARKNTLEGTAFVVDKLEGINKYYALTAYHVVAEIIATDDTIILRDENNHSISAYYKFEKKGLDTYDQSGDDYAVIEFESEVEYEPYIIINYLDVPQHIDCYYRGAIEHSNTIFCSISAKYESYEKTRYAMEDILSLSVNTDSVYKDKNSRLSSYEITCGGSGSPVLVNLDGKERCIGILTNISKDYSSPYRFAVPAIKAAKKIINIKNDIVDERVKVVSAKSFLDILFDADFTFSDDKTDQRIWNSLSNSLFQGNPIDLELGRIIETQEFNNLSGEIRCAVCYYYARLLYKRGRKEEARTVLNRVLHKSTDMSADSMVKINALAKARQSIEDVGILKRKPSTIRFPVSQLDEINSNPEYKAYEMASLFGKGIMNLFQAINVLNEKEKAEVISIYNEQKILHEKYPTRLAKQDVVLTSVEWYLALWDASTDLTVEALDSLIERGFFQAAKLRNNIFYIQCLLAMVISSLIKNNNSNAIILSIIVSKIMRHKHVLPNHEGISQLLRYIKDNYLPVYLSLKMIYEYSGSDNSELYIKLSNINVNLKMNNWKSILEQGQILYRHLYGNPSEDENEVEPYTIEYSEILNYLD